MADRNDNARGTASADAELLAALAEIAAHRDALPARLAAAARGAYTWRTVDAELAELLHDSALGDDAALAGIRGGSELRTLEFESAALRIELEVEHDRTLVVQLVPPVAAAVELRAAGRTIEAHSDELGRCVIEGAPSGPVSIRITPDGAPSIETPGLSL